MRISFEASERPLLVQKLGLADNASDEDIAAGFTEWANDQNPVTAEEEPQGSDPGGGEATPSAPVTPPQTPSNPEPEPSGSNPGPVANIPGPEASQGDDPVEDDDGVVVLDVAAYQSLTSRADRTKHLEEEQRLANRRTLIEGAIKDGKFGPARRAHYEARYDADQENTERLIARMQRGAVPVEERGVDSSTEEVETDAYDPAWVPEVHARQQAQPEHRNGNGERRPSRVTSEE